MTDNFESQKNIKASGYTLMICILLLLLFIYVSWTLPAQPQPVVEDGIEVNLGNSDQGLGSDQPYLPGQPSQQDKEKYTAPKQAIVEKEPLKDVETDDKAEDVPAIRKATVTKPNATKLPDKDITPKHVKAVKTPDIAPTPPKPHPKAIFGGVKGEGTGGNEADHYEKGGNQGIAGGHGDQGAPGGNPNSNNYTGGGNGNNGITAIGGLRGRAIVGLPSFTDDFNQNAKIVIDVHVDENGNVTSADYNMRGSTTSDASMVAIAKRKAKQVKFSSTGQESAGGLVFNFKIHN